ncbi:MAG: hypothetical protein WA399_12920, partial [Acidobacteriaceae bacterium]
MLVATGAERAGKRRFQSFEFKYSNRLHLSTSGEEFVLLRSVVERGAAAEERTTSSGASRCSRALRGRAAPRWS